MAPLLVGDPAKPNRDDKPWTEFRAHLAEMKKMGVVAVTTDVWWGIVEKEPGKFSWDYYDLLAKEITAAGLQWAPILSTHQCGGNVGDECDVPIPAWLWTEKFGPHVGTDFQYVSEYKNSSKETISVWGTPWALRLYRRFYKEFQEHFAPYARSLAEINLSLGPAGELRYPSYNSHDGKLAGYPTRGAFQSYSPIALADFHEWLARKYGKIERLNEAWGRKLATFADAPMPKDWGNADGQGGDLEDGIIATTQGHDFFDWYQDSLIRHGRMLLDLGDDVFHARGAPFSKVPLGAKVPGIHWRVGGDRYAELAAGMIRGDIGRWGDDEEGRGYRDLLSAFRTPGGNVPKHTLHFSCVEKNDGDGEKPVKSLAGSLVNWVGEEARRQGIPLRGENALSWSLPDRGAWDTMSKVMRTGLYEGITILRMADVASDKKLAHDEFQKLIKSHSGTK